MPASYPPILGGVQTVAHTLARGLAGRGHRVRVITKRYPRTLPARELLDDITVDRWLLLKPSRHDIQHGRIDLFAAACGSYPVRLLALGWLMRSFRPDIVNIHYPEAQIPFVLWMRERFRFRLVVSLHGYEIEHYFGIGRSAGPPEATALRRLLRSADAITACSRYLLDLAVRLEPTAAQKGTVIYNGIDAARFQDTTAHDHPRPYILAYGRLSFQKGFDLLLDAYARTIAQGAQLDLILAGEGEERAALEAQARRLGIDQRVYFFGRANQQQVVQLLNGCTFLVVPSRWEPFGIVALEGLAAGKPVLATNVGGLPEVLGGVNSQLAQPNVDTLAEQLMEWVCYPELDRCSQVARGYAEMFSWSHAIDRYLSVYEGRSDTLHSG